MKPKRTASVGALRLISAVLAFLFISCSVKQNSSEFPRNLQEVDALVSSGETVQALKKLAKLRPRARTSAQWLSIAKRERSLGNYDAAAETLLAAVESIPANKDLSGVLVDTLIEANRIEEACSYSRVLSDTTYQSLSAYAELLKAGKEDPFNLDPSIWKDAFHATGDQRFLLNAALLLAYAGKISEAQSLEGSARDNALFWAMLNFDAGFYERVFHHLPPDTASSRSLPEILLMADSAALLADISQARIFWQRLLDKDPFFSPYPYYNLAASSPLPYEAESFLESCLLFFPSYYPALARYVRSVPEESEKTVFNALDMELAESGFISLEMQEKQRYAPLDAEKARRFLDAALAVPLSPPDSRLFIEEFKFSQGRDSDTVRSSSDMWILLEKLPHDSVLHSYALWYFASIGNYDACFGLNSSTVGSDGLFYRGLEAALQGDLEEAEKAFLLSADKMENSWFILANIARIKQRKGEYEAALQWFLDAGAIVANNRLKSRIHYEAAKILLELRYVERAELELRYAIEMDASNYLSGMLLRELEAGK